MKWIFKKIFSFIYAIISFFNLQFALGVSLVGFVLYFTGTFNKNASVLLVFQLVLILSIVFAVVESIRKLLGLSNKVKKSKGAQIVSTGDNEKKRFFIFRKKVKPQNEENISEGQETENEGELKTPQEQTFPQYFRVKNSPNMIMAEYIDRYELYQVDNGKMIKIRTDYK